MLVVGGYFTYRLVGENKETVAAVEPPKADETPAPSNDSTSAPATADAATSPSGTAPEAAAPAGESTAAPPDTEAPAAPSAPTADTTKSPPPPPKAHPAQAATEGRARGHRPAAKGVPATGTPGTGKMLAKAPGAAAPAPDRWQMYAEALAECEKLDFFSRFGCEQRQRWHYCDGYWGQVPQCPLSGGGLPRDRGQ